MHYIADRHDVFVLAQYVNTMSAILAFYPLAFPELQRAIASKKRRESALPTLLPMQKARMHSERIAQKLNRKRMNLLAHVLTLGILGAEARIYATSA